MRPFQIHSSKFPWNSEETKQMHLKGIDDIMITVTGFVGILCKCSIIIPEDKRELFSICNRAEFYCVASPKDFANIPPIWISVVKGSPDDGFEISVAKSSAHGVKSWGWFGEDKILISHSGTSGDIKIPQRVWDKLIKIANEVRDEMNNNESI